MDIQQPIRPVRNSDTVFNPILASDLWSDNVKESDVQKSIVQWCGYKLKKSVLYWSTPNERNPIHNMGGMKAMGLQSGVSDLMFVWNDGALQNLYIEVKRPTTYKMGKRGKMIIDQRGGEQTEAQGIFQLNVEALDCPYHIVDNLQDFIDLIRKYGLER